MGIGARLKEIIDDRGTNVNQIAKQTDTSPMTIYSIIKRDNTKVDIEILLKICKALNVSVEDIYQPNFKANSNANISKTTQTTSEDTITPHERELINAYREQPESVQAMICKMLDVDYPVSETQAKKIV